MLAHLCDADIQFFRKKFSVADLHTIVANSELRLKSLPPSAGGFSPEYTFARMELDRLQESDSKKMESAPICSESELIRQLEEQKREMEAMKAMMEAMRAEKALLEKERLEAEAKRKEEEEAAIRKAEMEATLRREKVELEKAFQQFRDYAVAQAPSIYKNPNENTFGKMETQLLKKLEEDGETVLLAEFNKEILYGNPDVDDSIHESGCVYPNIHAKGISMILTNRNVYGVYYNMNGVEYCQCKHYQNALIKQNHGIRFHHAALYSFSEPLNLQHAKLLSNIIKHTTQKSSLWSRVASNLCAYSFKEKAPILYSATKNVEWLMDSKKLESVIRLIPGSYHNGDWRQLDGFFGMYYNETTMEVSEYPCA